MVSCHKKRAEGAEFAGGAVRCPRRLWFLGAEKGTSRNINPRGKTWPGKLILLCP